MMRLALVFSCLLASAALAADAPAVPSAAAPLLAVTPPSVYDPACLGGSHVHRTLAVLAVDDPGLRALSAEASKPYRTVALKPLESGAKKGLEVALDVAPDAPIGRLEERVMV